jgi:hypothetical protein
VQVAPVEIVSICDPDKHMLAGAVEIASQRQKSRQRPRTYGDYREMLKEKELANETHTFRPLRHLRATCTGIAPVALPPPTHISCQFPSPSVFFCSLHFQGSISRSTPSTTALASPSPSRLPPVLPSPFSSLAGSVRHQSLRLRWVGWRVDASVVGRGWIHGPSAPLPDGDWSRIAWRALALVRSGHLRLQ